MRKTLRIGTQLLLGFAVLLVLMAILGTVGYMQTHKIHEQTITMYEHPLQVRIALGALDSDIKNLLLGMRDLLLSRNDQDRQTALQMTAQASADVDQQFEIIRHQYLGPADDVTNAYKAYIAWKTVYEEYIQLALMGETEKVWESLHPQSAVGAYREDMLKKIHTISLFALYKGDELYAASNAMHDRLNGQLILLISIFLLFAILISYHLVKSIRKPLTEMNDAVLRFRHGDMQSRSSYTTANEFGILSSTINKLADKVQENDIYNHNIVQLAQAMLREDDAAKFFLATLSALAEYTGARLAAAYLPGGDHSVFELYKSIGTGEEAKRTFRADCYEGEFGEALYKRKVQHIRNIAEDTRFAFHTVNGRFIPKEIIAIPILSGSDVIALISLATLGEFEQSAFRLIDGILVTMSTRIQGVLALRRIKEYQHELQQQNHELDAQQQELTAQTSELTQQNTELEMQKKQLDEASRLKTNFLSNMSHELRTPLNSVIALTGVLGRRLADRITPEELNFLDVIERNGKSLLTLINDILDIARIESGREEADISTFHINKLIDEVLVMLRPQAEQKNVQLLFKWHEPSPIIDSDAEKCRHILLNLVGNAIKFTEKGSVSISVQSTEEQIMIRISDTGIGIAPEHIPYIFDEFRQADGSLARRYGGAGLGLSIAKRYALLLRGDISVTSKMNEGSEFTLHLPVQFTAGKWENSEQVSSAPAPISPADCKPDACTSRKTILLVEDNDVAVIQIKDLVEEMGIDVLVAGNADEALKLIGQKIPDAMILDLMMPGIDGFKLLEILRNAEPTAHTPVLILTAKHISKDELKFLKRNNIHQLIRKGDSDREGLQQAITSLFVQGPKHPEKPGRAKPGSTMPVVLVTEDDPDNMITAKALLKNRFIVLEAHNALECIQMTEKHIPDLILMDIALSGMSGIEAFKQIRKNPQQEHIPVIALTASAMVHEREAILAHGFDAFIPKPIIEEQFSTVINEVLYGKKKM